MEEQWQETQIHRTTLLIAETVTKTVTRTATDRTVTDRMLPGIRLPIRQAIRHPMHPERTRQVLTIISSKTGTNRKKAA